MDELTIAKMRVMREAGMSYEKIGKSLGVSRDTAVYHLSEHSKEHYQQNREIKQLI